MNAVANPLGPPVPPPAPIETGRKWYLELLATSRELVGLPTLVVLILGVFTSNTKIIALGTGLAVVVALVLRFFPKVGHLLRPRTGHAFVTALPWLMTAALSVILVFVVIPSRAIKQSSLLANSWLEWQKDLEKSAGHCLKNDAPCLAEALAPVIDRRPRPVHESDVTGLASDLVAGQLLLANDNARTLLNSRLSIGEKFVGSGFSEPVGQTDYTAARVPEYLVPNLSDKAPHVWVWELDHQKVENQRPIMERNLLEVLHTSPLRNHADFQENWGWMKEHMGPKSPRPVLVRFALMDMQKKPYSGCLGRPDATRVFMSNLGELASKTVGEAARSTGYNVPKKSDEPGLKLFIWVYAPTEENQAVSATWGSVLVNFGTWITAEPCKIVP